MFPQGFQIGHLRIEPATVLAPMAGVTDTVFRRLIRSQGGCGLIMTEFTSSHGVVATSKATRPTRTFRYLYFDPDEQCVTKMVRFMDAHPDCGVSGCRLYRPDGSFGFPARRFQTLSTIAARRLGLAGLLGKTVESYLHRDKPQNSVFDCDWLSGCFLMVRRQAVNEVGLLDVGFRKYFEDVDFCLRMARAGWRVMMNGQT